MKLLVIATYDSQLKVASFIAQEFVNNKWQVDFRIPQLVRANQISQKQLEDFSIFKKIEYCQANTSAILENAMSYDAILIMTEGTIIQEFCYQFYQRVKEQNIHPRPLIITGFVGVGLFDTVIGYQRRLNSDVLFLNSQKDYDDCEKVARSLNLPIDNMIISGMPFIGEIDYSFDPGKEVKTVLFAGQPDVPRRVIERVYLLEKMIEYARKFPEREVLFKPRHRPNEVSLHKTEYHYEVLLKSYLRNVDVPENFRIVYDPIKELLKNTQLFITMTSTAVMEALEYNCLVALVTDLGISERLGNNYFMGSGMLSTFEEIFDEQYSSPDKDWIDNNLRSKGDASRIIYNKVMKLLDQQKNNPLPYNRTGRSMYLVKCRHELEKKNKLLVRNYLNTIFFYIKRIIYSRMR